MPEKYSTICVGVVGMREVNTTRMVAYCRQCFQKRHFLYIFFFQVMSHDCKVAIVRLVLIFKKITVDFTDFIQSKII